MKYVQWHMPPGKILFLTPLKGGLQRSYCNKHLCHLMLNRVIKPQSSGGQKGDSAISMRDNTGADIMIDIISVGGNLHPSEEDYYRFKTMLMF